MTAAAEPGTQPGASSEVVAPSDADSRAASEAVPESDAGATDVVRQATAEPPAHPAASPRPPPAVPTIQAQPFLFREGSCPECKRGEWALVVERRASPSTSSDVECGENRQENVESIIEQLLTPRAEALGAFAGPLLDAHGNGVVAQVGSPASLSAYEALASEGACQDFVAILPSEARFVGFRFEVTDAAVRGDCFGTDVCSIGDSHWTELPQIERASTLTVIHTSFLNESKGRERHARLVVLFVPADGWRAP